MKRARDHFELDILSYTITVRVLVDLACGHAQPHVSASVLTFVLVALGSVRE